MKFAAVWRRVKRRSPERPADTLTPLFRIMTAVLAVLVWDSEEVVRGKKRREEAPQEEIKRQFTASVGEMI